MDLKVLAVILMYYIGLGSLFLFGGAYLGDSTFSGDLNTGGIENDEITTGGIFGSGVSFGRFLGLMTIGVGLPSNTPSFIQILFTLIQSTILLFNFGFIISSIWNG